jgi:hypothetical protein
VPGLIGKPYTPPIAAPKPRTIERVCEVLGPWPLERGVGTSGCVCGRRLDLGVRVEVVDRTWGDGGISSADLGVRVASLT